MKAPWMPRGRGRRRDPVRTLNRRRTLAAGALHFSADLYSRSSPSTWSWPAWTRPGRHDLRGQLTGRQRPAAGHGLWADRVRGKLPVFLGLVVGAVGMSMIGLTRNYACWPCWWWSGARDLPFPSGRLQHRRSGRRRAQRAAFSIFMAVASSRFAVQPTSPCSPKPSATPPRPCWRCRRWPRPSSTCQGRMAIAGPRQSVTWPRPCGSCAGAWLRWRCCWRS